MINKNKYTLYFFISTCLGIGKLPKWIAVTIASLIAIPLTYAMFVASRTLRDTLNISLPSQDITLLLDIALSLLMLILLIPIAIYSSSAYSKQIKETDPQEVIIDEVLGQSLSLILTLPLTLPLLSFAPDILNKFNLPAPTILIIGVILNIILFRLFDSFKPWPINLLEKLKGGFGIVLDDIAAGVFATVIYFAILLALTN